jgi:uncharacterized protein (DUF2141 family)
MSKKITILSLSTLILICASKVKALDLAINVDNIAASKGNIECYLHNDQDTFPRKFSKAIASDKVSASIDGASCNFTNLKAGTYAALIYHDMNSSGSMDKNFIGLPKEPVAVSNNFKPKFGPPKFDNAKFELIEDKVIQVSLNNPR